MSPAIEGHRLITNAVPVSPRKTYRSVISRRTSLRAIGESRWWDNGVLLSRAIGFIARPLNLIISAAGIGPSLSGRNATIPRTFAVGQDARSTRPRGSRGEAVAVNAVR